MSYINIYKRLTLLGEYPAGLRKQIDRETNLKRIRLRKEREWILQTFELHWSEEDFTKEDIDYIQSLGYKYNINK